MLRHHFALIFFLGVPLLTSSAFGQTRPAQPPITCEIKDNIEDAACRNKLKGLFTRKGDTLILRLDGGKSTTYVGNLAACDGENVDPSKCLVFRVLSYFPQTPARRARLPPVTTWPRRRSTTQLLGSAFHRAIDPEGYPHRC